MSKSDIELMESLGIDPNDPDAAEQLIEALADNS